MAQFNIEVVRTGYGSRTITVEAENREEAEDKALDAAGNLEYSDKGSDYKTSSQMDEERAALTEAVGYMRMLLQPRLDAAGQKRIDEICETLNCM